MKVAEYVQDVADRLPDADRVAAAVDEYGASGRRPEPRLYEIAEIDDGSIELVDGAQKQYEEDLENGDIKILDVDEDKGVIVGEYRPEQESLGEAAAEGYGMVKALNRGRMPWNRDAKQQTSKQDSGGFTKNVAAHMLGDGLYDRMKAQVSG